MDISQRKLIKIAIILVIAIIVVIVEFIRMQRRRRIRAEAYALGPQEYLDYLKKEYHELKFRYDTSQNRNEQDKWLREMKDIEQKIILTERHIENTK